jgi:hypothetical protein
MCVCVLSFDVVHGIVRKKKSFYLNLYDEEFFSLSLDVSLTFVNFIFFFLYLKNRVREYYVDVLANKSKKISILSLKLLL